MRRPFKKGFAQEVSVYAKKRTRPSSPFFKYKGMIKVKLTNVHLSNNDPRVQKIDESNVEDLMLDMTQQGLDDDAELGSVLKSKKEGHYDVFDQHHCIESLKRLGKEELWLEEYEYVGTGSEADKWAAASDFGQKINNLHILYKKTTMASVVAAALAKIRQTGYIFREGTPVNEDMIFEWMKEVGHTARFHKGKVTEMINKILNPNEYTGVKTRSITKNLMNDLCAASKGYYGSGNLVKVNSDRYGFIVKTDNYASDAPKTMHSILSHWDKDIDLKPVIITYSGKEDANDIITNHQLYVNKLYQTYQTHLRAIQKLHRIKFDELTYDEFLDKIEVAAFSQIEKEYNEGDFTTRVIPEINLENE